MRRDTNVRDDVEVVDDDRHETARDRFGGLDLPAAIVGVLTAVASMLLIGGIITAIAETQIGYQDALSNVQEATVSAVAISLLILVVSFVFGGWAAGRMSRFDGATNGFLVGALAIVLGIVIAALTAWAGAEYNLVPNVNLSQFADPETMTQAGVIGSLIALAAILISSTLGGQLGERYNAAVDSRLSSFGGVTTRRRQRVADGVGVRDGVADPAVHDERTVRRTDID